MISPGTGGWSKKAQTYDSSIRSSTDGIVSDKELMLELQLVKERLKITKEFPLGQVADWSLFRELKWRR